MEEKDAVPVNAISTAQQVPPEPENASGPKLPELEPPCLACGDTGVNTHAYGCRCFCSRNDSI